MKGIQIALDNLPYLVQALPNTFYILFVSVAIAFVLGLGLTWMKVCRFRILRAVAGVYISFQRGTPMIAQILIVFIAMPMILQSLGINTIGIQTSLYAIIAFSMNEAAFFAEIFRSAYLAIEKGQIEAGQSIGMNRFQIFRRIILPQAAASALPNTTNMIIELMKNTSLGMAIGVVDLMAKANQLALNNYGVGQMEIFIAAGIMYWLIGIVFMVISDLFTKWLNRSKNARTETRAKKKWFMKAS